MLSAAAVLGATAVLIGAFLAHGLEGRLAAKEIGWFDTASRYQLVHALALALCSLLARTGSAPRASAACFAFGSVLFSGSLYLLALTGWRPLALVTPCGGIALVAGWLLLLRHCRAEPAATVSSAARGWPAGADSGQSGASPSDRS